jgi:lipopolysaccharide/colanic/teichoic acid biosynthesis glycosyltransferase
MAKRCFDLAVAALGLVVLSPVLTAVALLVRTTLGPPVLFRQVRAGLRGEPFVIYKFRTMRPPDAPDEGPLRDRERLTRVGAMLRATSLDELPELWNVLTGDMSLVGPRPLLPEYLDRYTPQQAQRHDVRPGLTGLAQVSGRNALTWEAKFDLDLQYVEQRSFLLDLRILGRTLAQVVGRSGVTTESGPTAPLFLGSAAR